MKTDTASISGFQLFIPVLKDPRLTIFLTYQVKCSKI